MGNSIWCSVSGERLASAARDGDLAEAKYLLEHDSRIAAYSSFTVMNSPLHLAASKGHTEVRYNFSKKCPHYTYLLSRG